MKRWGALMLVVAFLVTTATMYSLNKVASAVSEETAEDVGMVLNQNNSGEDSDVAYSTEEISAESAADTSESGDEENATSSEDASANTSDSSETASADSDASGEDTTDNSDNATSDENSSDNSVTEDNAASTETTDDNSSSTEEGSDASSEASSDNQIGENTDSSEIDSTKEGTSTENPTTDNSSTENSLAGQAPAEGENAADKALTSEEDELKTEDQEGKEAEGSKAKEGTLASGDEVELTEDVVLTVSYVDEENNSIADEKEISLSESLDFTTEAPKQDGYEFMKAAIDGTEITKITAKQDANGFRYYEVALADAENAEEATVVIKENKTVVLTYIKEVIIDGGIKLTARYLDKDGVEIKEASELAITSETELKQDETTNIDGFFYVDATYNDQKVVRITPVFDEKQENTETAETDENVEAENEETENSEAVEATDNKVVIKEFIITNAANEQIVVTEDADIVFNYIKLTSEKNFEYSDEKVIVKAETTSEGAFPEGIELKVTEVNSSTENYSYDAYMNALNENAESIAKDAGLEEACQYNEANTLLYDIAFMYEGIEIQPLQGSVNVSIEFKNNQLSNDLQAVEDENIAVVHLPIKEEVKEASDINSTEEATQIKAEDVEVKTLIETTADVDNGENANETVEFKEDSFSVFAVISYQKHEPGTDTFETILGDAINFGIVANRIKIKESETNFAVNIADASDQSGNDLTNPVEQTFMAASVNGSFQLKGEDAYFIVPKEYASRITHVNEVGGDHVKFDTAYTSEEITKLVDDMRKYTRDASNDLASRKDNATVVVGNDGKYYLDIRANKPGTYYVTFNSEDMKQIAQDDWLNVYKRDDQTVVFNVTTADNISLHKFRVNDVPTGEAEMLKQANNASKTIIWNFINATNVKTCGSVVGVLLSGHSNAHFENAATSAGWVMFPDVEITSGEWHNTYDHIRQISGMAQFQAYKTIDGKDASVSGFKFNLYKWNGNNWSVVETVENDHASPHNVFFNSVTFGGDSEKTDPHYQYVSAKNVGESQDFLFAIGEINGSTDENGKAYYPDENIYYAKVTVTLQKMNEISGKGIYYRVSTPEYYTDSSLTKNTKINGNIPTFNNKTINGSVGILLRKYLNGADPGNLKFGFTIRALTSNGTNFKVLNNNVYNDGSRISYAFKFDSDSKIIYNDSIYLVITENDIPDGGSGINIKKDSSYIIARVNNPGKDNQSVDYYKLDANNSDDLNRIKSLEESVGKEGLNKDNIPFLAGHVMAKTKRSANKIANEDEVAFYNTGTGRLRIHKMVINDWDADFVRDGKEFSMLNHCTFRITNNATKNYIVFRSFVGDPQKPKMDGAVEYDGKTHKPTGNYYPVSYNRSAQWTIDNLPSGTYTVEEVGDDITFAYEPSSNSITYLYDSNLSRVTKYDVTVDGEGASSIGTGGDNYRVVYSIDLPNHYDHGPTDVKVGDNTVNNKEGSSKSHTQTVQVCNYYSLPVGPIKIAKNFTGGKWNKNMEFQFRIDPVSYTAWDSAGNGVSIPTGQPMPIGGNTIALTGKDAKKNKDGSYSAIGMFTSIPYRFEGIYYYKITEVDTGLGGVIYDTSEYYVEIKVTKKHTEFNKTYNGENMANQGNYSNTGQTTVREDFFYLGADIRYATDKKFDNVVAQCELYLGKDPKTDTPLMNEFQVNYTYGKADGSSVVFNNSLAGKLVVSKKWFDMDGKDDMSGHSPLTLYIWQRKVGEKDWHSYNAVSSVTLSDENKWTYTVDNLLIEDADGNRYEYCIKEPDEFLTEYAVTYSVTSSKGNEKFFANDSGKITVDGVNYKDPGYILNVDAKGNYGTVEILNTKIVTNVLPESGGEGTIPYMATGAAMITLAVIAMLYSRKKREK
ncbi:Spy0128 family protein [Butyrivibrio sp. WCE2006]|uniref:Spy0128 family protein n=1 Tax=Butyrivibrio sp. WCE2006 TaxID=1410611 RepID=UPI001A9A61D4